MGPEVPLNCGYIPATGVYTTKARRGPLCTQPECVHKSAEMCTHPAAKCVHTTEGTGELSAA